MSFDPMYVRTDVGTYDVVIEGEVVASVQAEDGGWAVWVPEENPRPHQRLVCVRNSRAAAAQAGLAYLEGQGRT